MPTYEEVKNADGIVISISRTDENGEVWSIPVSLENSDYQAYLNKDKPQVEHLTEIITPTTD
jgi:hypothetical protein